MIHVLLAEDHALMREGVRVLMEKAGDIYIVGEACNGQEACKMALDLKPDVVVMDIMMPLLNGIQAAERIHDMQPGTRVILLSMYIDEGLVYQALKSGVKGYVLKTSVSDELIWAIRAVARNETYLCSPISKILMENAIHNPGKQSFIDPLASLSPREREILQLVAEEHTSGEIARLLNISEKTVEKHRTSIMEKLDTHNIAGLVKLAVKYGLVDRTPS
jgi:DNA-binding NarL/FixJ family response regulator